LAFYLVDNCNQLMFRHFASGYVVVDLYKVVSSAEAADIVSVTEALFIPTINPSSTLPPQKKYKTKFGLPINLLSGKNISRGIPQEHLFPSV
jgi:hypothetical protein